jgi:aminoglycoside phosphotransferase (APT) family kinase protein
MTEAPVFSKGRDLDEARRALEPWFASHLERRDVHITDFSYPAGAGVSNETILLRVDVPGAGPDEPTEYAIRIHPAPEYQLFLEPEFRLQFQLLDALHGAGLVKVARPYWYEADASVLGREFFVMERLHGQVPVSMPVYNSTGWLYEATPAQRRVLWESAATELARIHLVPDALVAFVDRPQWGPTGVEQQLSYWDRCLAWTMGDRVPDIMFTIRQWLGDNVPAQLENRLSWGDARMGNMMFGPDFRLVGVNDWEQATLSGPMQDLGWWLFFDDYHSVDHDLPRLDGLGSRQETIDLWEDITGEKVHDILFYEVFTGYKVATLAMRSMNLGSVAGKGIEPPRLAFVERTCRLLDLELPAELSP